MMAGDALSLLHALEDRIAGFDSALVCYSGGVDSALVLAVATRVLGQKAVGMTAVSPSLAPMELEMAVKTAKAMGARHELVDSQEIEKEAYQANGPDRCFHCKSELYDLSEKMQAKWGLAVTLNGTNIEDLGDYRPGLEAAKNAGVVSPLVEAGFGKADVRLVAEHLGVEVWDKPASACLASRLPYGTRVTRERLSRIAAFEAALRRAGFSELRVRYHELGLVDGNEQALARVELGGAEMPKGLEQRAELVRWGKEAGFAYVTLDLGGYRKGSTNELLGAKRLPVVAG